MFSDTKSRSYANIVHTTSLLLMKFRSDLHAGRAGEHIAAAEILSLGYECFHAAQGMPYDLVADVDGRLMRVQVKTTRLPEDVACRNVNSFLYRFYIARCGKGGKGRYKPDDVDLFAVVALDTKQVGFVGANKMPSTIFLRAEARRGQYQDEVIAARNGEVRAALDGGMTNKEAAAKFGMHPDYVSKLRRGRIKSRPAGFYFSDLTLDVAIASLSDDNGRKLSGRRPKGLPLAA